ncbi:MAG: hypothetical protein R3B09_32325 [Nannocystaceae bacterium]
MGERYQIRLATTSTAGRRPRIDLGELAPDVVEWYRANLGAGQELYCDDELAAVGTATTWGPGVVFANGPGGLQVACNAAHPPRRLPRGWQWALERPKALSRREVAEAAVKAAETQLAKLTLEIQAKQSELEELVKLIEQGRAESGTAVQFGRKLRAMANGFMGNLGFTTKPDAGQ